ncbi:hypothetical protein [Clostridium oryzae]|uniref:Uncharacterized protein n=1 Tax=Clostridium oryzae TaxID=1450648 RepID=A0A1V4IK30_9CLOT|nr:hypothetical protein [Clostridium oryzae]OPJ59857.1 hypothetical protein CLORY_30740 [Clostridium oryzae]
MDSLTISNSQSSKDIYNANEYKNTSDKNKCTNNNLDNTNIEITDKSNISDDAMVGYKFFKRLEASSTFNDKDSSVNKYISEYEKIKKEIASGTYGNDKDKYKDLLNNAFKNIVSSISDSVIKQSNQAPKIKLSTSALIECQREHDNATTFVWIFKAENKRILKEIEYYKKKKNHRLVNSLRQLSASYKHVINNLSSTAEYINNNISDSLNSYASKDLEKIRQLESE